MNAIIILGVLLLGWPTGLAVSAQSTSSPKSQAEVNEEAQNAYRAGIAASTNNDFKAAETQFETVVRLVPQIEEGHAALAEALLRLGKFPQAIKELEEALVLKPGDVSAQTNLALAYEQTGAHKRAIALFSKIESAAQQTPASDSFHALPSAVHESYARALAATSQIGPAISQMKLAVAGTPRADLHDALGSLYAQQGSWSSAVPEFQEAIRLDSRFGAAHMHLGAALLMLQQAPAALAELKLAAQLTPNSPVATVELGKAYVANNADTEAAAEFQRASKLDPRSLDAKYQLALLLQRNDHHLEAIPLFRQVVAADPKDAEASANLGLALLLTGNAKDAIPFLERRLRQKPGDTTAHENVAAAYLQMNEVEEAIQVLQSGLKNNPKSFQLHYNLGLALKLKDDNSAAIRELRAASKLNPTAYEPHYTLGTLLMQDGGYDEAASELSLAMKLHPENADGWATLGSLYRKMNKLPEAENALREAIRQMPDQPDSHLTLATVLVQQGKTAEAAAERKKGAELERVTMNRQRANVSTNSGNSLLQKGQITEAIERYQQALSEDPNYAGAHRGLANALERQGKTEEAAAEREKADELEKSQP